MRNQIVRVTTALARMFGRYSIRRRDHYSLSIYSKRLLYGKARKFLCRTRNGAAENFPDCSRWTCEDIIM